MRNVSANLEYTVQLDTAVCIYYSVFMCVSKGTFSTHFLYVSLLFHTMESVLHCLSFLVPPFPFFQTYMLEVKLYIVSSNTWFLSKIFPHQKSLFSLPPTS
jgi:hypothetical protein